MKMKVAIFVKKNTERGDFMRTYRASIYSNARHKWYELSATCETYEEAQLYFYSEMEDGDIILKITDDRGYLV